MANLKNTRIDDTGFLCLPTSGAGNTGTLGQLRYNAAKRNVEHFSPILGGRWESTIAPWETRTIVTTGYLNGGYAASAVWNNTNKITYATDTTIDLGDNSQEAAHNYQSSAHNDIKSFTWGASNAHCVAASNVICFNMRTDQPITSGYTRSWPYAHINNGTIQQYEERAWVTSTYGSSAIYEWNLTTEILGALQNNSGGQNWGTSHEFYGIFYGNGERIFNYATRQTTTRSGTVIAGDGLQHTIPFKKTFHVAGREGNPSTNWRETNMITNTSADAIGTKAAYSGEENHLIAQDWGYCLGFYNGTHVNTSYKMIYATRAQNTGSSTMQPKGKVGNSSGTMNWRT